MKPKSQSLRVLLNGILVGELKKSATGSLMFAYDKVWRATPGARPISLSLPLAAEVYAGDVVYNFFDNLLPDNPQIRARIQAKFSALTNQPFDLLASIGQDCVGAIQITDNKNSEFVKSIQCEPLNDMKVAEILKGYREFPLGMTADFDEFRISIAGAQEKTAFLYHEGKWQIPLQQTPTSHIFKLPIGFIQHQNIDLSDSCENEWLCSQIAQAFGLPVAHCEILYFENVKVLSIERFDRKNSSDNAWIMRIPQEDICQALGISPNLKYQSDGGPGMEDIMGVLRGSTQPEYDLEIFYRSQVLFWLLAAIDGHAKNFSIFIEPEGKYKLTPLYDIMSAHPLIEKKQLQAQKIKMAMALKSKSNHYKWNNVQRRHFIASAHHIRYSPEKAEAILDDMLGQVDTVIEQVSSTLPDSFPKSISHSIFNGMRLFKDRLEAKIGGQA